MRDIIKVDILNELKVSKMQLKVYHHQTQLDNIIGNKQTLTVPLIWDKNLTEKDYLSIIYDSNLPAQNKGDMKAKDITILMPNWQEFKFTIKNYGETTILRTADESQITIIPIPPQWILSIWKPESKFTKNHFQIRVIENFRAESVKRFMRH